MITTNVTAGQGNFICTATDPAGEWSDPHWLDAPGIDPSLYFEGDRAWYQGTHDRPGGHFWGDNEIYIQELCLKTMKLIGHRHIIWHCALKYAKWSESPHIYKKGDWYYLLISEGGTGHEHAVTIARSRGLTDFYEGYDCNPILTHRHLGRDYPIVNVGHADLVETQNGDWWMVMLASRPYGGYFRNMGRETFLVPVTWENEWPVVNYGVGIVQQQETAPNLPSAPVNFTPSVDFTQVKVLPPHLMHIKNPIREDYILSDNGLKMRLAAGEISKMEAMSYLCLRQTHHDYEVSTSLEFTPENDNEAAGLVAYQNHDYSYRLLRTTRGIVVIKCEKNVHTTLAECAFSENTATLKITARAQSMNFYVNDALIFEGACGRMLTSDVAGGFVGTTLGIYATAHGADSQRYATFRNILYTGMPADTV